MRPAGAAALGTGVRDLEKGIVDEQASEMARKASAAAKTGLFFTTLG